MEEKTAEGGEHVEVRTTDTVSISYVIDRLLALREQFGDVSVLVTITKDGEPEKGMQFVGLSKVAFIVSGNAAYLPSFVAFVGSTNQPLDMSDMVSHVEKLDPSSYPQ